MKILVGEFITESNANIPQKCEISNYKMLFGDDCIQALHVADVFEQAGFELIPSVVADAGAAGVIKKDTFDYIESCFVRTVKEHIHEIDGMFLMLHGASEVEGIGSGDHHILAEIRKVVGPYLPIFVVCDPHGNLCKEYAEATTLIRSYRESPHTDSIATMRKVAAMLCDFMKDRQNIHSVYRKLPLILGGEQSVSGDEPVRSINEYMDKLEQDPHIRSVSWHVGYIRHDTPVAGCGIVVVPQTEADLPYAEEAADWLAVYVWNKRREFHYTGLTAAPDKALRMALEFEGKPAFITDSGDNVTSGATGWNTYILRQVLVEKELKKKILFANICDPVAYQKLAQLEIGAKACLHLGVNQDVPLGGAGCDGEGKGHSARLPAPSPRCRVWLFGGGVGGRPATGYQCGKYPPDHVRRAPVRGGWTGLGRIRCDCGQAGLYLSGAEGKGCVLGHVPDAGSYPAGYPDHSLQADHAPHVPH